MTDDLRPRHRRSLDLATTYVDTVTDLDLTRATPCAGWDLAALLAHMVGQHRGFIAAVRDGDAPAAAYGPEPYSSPAWHDSVGALVTSFADADPDATVLQVELAPTTPLPVRVLVSAQLLDTVVHTWDVARALDLAFTPPDDLVDAVAALFPLIPDDGQRLAPGAPFAPAVDARAGTDGWSAILTWLGRDPAWTPA